MYIIYRELKHGAEASNQQNQIKTKIMRTKLSEALRHKQNLIKSLREEGRADGVYIGDFLIHSDFAYPETPWGFKPLKVTSQEDFDELKERRDSLDLETTHSQFTRAYINLEKEHSDEDLYDGAIFLFRISCVDFRLNLPKKFSLSNPKDSDIEKDIFKGIKRITNGLHPKDYIILTDSRSSLLSKKDPFLSELFKKHNVKGIKYSQRYDDKGGALQPIKGFYDFRVEQGDFYPSKDAKDADYISFSLITLPADISLRQAIVYDKERKRMGIESALQWVKGPSIGFLYKLSYEDVKQF